MKQTYGGFALIGFGSRVASLGHFAWHFLEMMLAMVVGMAALGWPTRAVLGLLGVPALESPVVSVLIMAFAMTVPMAAWMRFRGMERDRILEMSGAMFVEAALLIGACWIGIISEGSLVGLQHSLMIPVMLLPMLYRRHAYMGHTGHRAHLA